MSTAKIPGTGGKGAVWTPWVTMALVAVVAGLLVPQLMPGEVAVEKPRTKAEPKGKPSPGYTAPAIPDAPNPQVLLLRLAAGTIVVLGLSVASIWGMRRWMQPSGSTGSGAREMRLIETLHLGNRCALHLVHLGQREVLVGVDGAGVKTVVPLARAFEDVLAETQTITPAAQTLPFSQQAA